MKKKWLQIRVSEEELQELKRLSEQMGLKVSKFVLISALGKEPSKEKEAAPVELDAVEPMKKVMDVLQKEEKKFKPRLCSRCRNVGSHQKQCTIPGCGGS